MNRVCQLLIIAGAGTLIAGLVTTPWLTAAGLLAALAGLYWHAAIREGHTTRWAQRRNQRASDALWREFDQGRRTPHAWWQA